MPLVQTRGAASAQGFGEFAQAAATINYIEEMFSTFLYTGTGAAQTITNGIDLSTKGGLVWIKNRSNAESHSLWDTARGVSAGLQSNATSAQYSDAISLTAYNSNGFSLGTDANVGWVNRSPDTYVSWTFREQPKFFDVVTYTGTGSNTTIAHSLGVVPGSIIVKRTDTTAAWAVYHRSLANTQYLVLNTTAAAATGATWWNSTTPTSAVFSVGTDASVNASGGTYVAYLFAHDAGGFGLAGTDNVISCGSFSTGAGGGATVTLGYEPQWLMIKSSSNTSAWYMFDTMRGWVVGDASRGLSPNTPNAEFNFGSSSLPANPTATGFTFTNGLFAASETWIYIAIRRGPMKVPTLGTSVFKPVAYTGTSVTRDITGVGFPLDMNLTMDRATHTYNVLSDRLRGLTCDGVSVQQPQLRTNATDAEALITNGINGTSSSAMDGYTLYNAYSQMNAAPDTYVSYNFRRAPGFFDVVCYTGTGVARTVTHNLAAVPELMIVKRRSTAGEDWYTYSSATGNTKYLYIDGTASAQVDSRMWNDTTPTSSVFTVGTYGGVNSSGDTFVAYLFATCAGVSKVGSYTGNGTTQTIDCGFGAGGARFVLIKRTDSTGGWYTYDTARGMTVLTDPYLLLNSAAAEVATLGSVTTVSTGFALDSTILAAINISAGTYIFLAIA